MATGKPTPMDLALEEIMLTRIRRCDHSTVEGFVVGFCRKYSKAQLRKAANSLAGKGLIHMVLSGDSILLRAAPQSEEVLDAE